MLSSGATRNPPLPNHSPHPGPATMVARRLALTAMATNFADRLRALSDEALGAFIQLRPDLVVPVPSDLSALAIRAQARASVARCLDALDEFTLLVLDAARLTRAPES